MKNKLIWLVLGFIIVMMSLPISSVSAAPEGKVVYVTNSPNFYVTGLDWFTARGYVSNSIKVIFTDSLIVKNIDGSFSPGLAESWEVSNGGKTYKFTLVKNAKFHDGSPITAEDVKYSLERYAKPELKYVFGKEWEEILKDIVVEDDYHLTINFNDLYPDFFDRNGEYFGIAPKKYIEQVGDKGFADKPIGSGPFKLVKFDYDVSFEATAVADHYRKPPSIKDLTLMFVTENQTRMAMLKTGEADIIYLHGSQLPEAQKDPNIRISRSDYCNLEAFCFYDFMNGTKGPWQDIRVRQAVDYAVDRKMICDKVLNGNFKPYRGIIAPYNPGFDPAKEVPTKYDPEKAKALLKEAGYDKGITANMYFLTSRKPQAEAIAGYLSAVGINLKMNMMENAPLVKKTWARELEGVGLATGVWWVGRVHTGVALKSFQTNTARYGYSASQEITDLVNKSLTTVDEKEVAKISREITDVYLKQVNQLTLWATSYTIGIGPKVAEAPAISGWPQPSGFEYFTLK